MIDTEPASAKLNLALHVRYRRADGYHQLETLFAFVEAGDEIQVGATQALEIDGPFAGVIRPEPNNLILRAVAALRAATGITTEAPLRLTKNLPVASGIGGGSADAAATLRLLNRFWGLNWSTERLAALGADLGADVPACVWSRTMRGEGRGEQLRPLEDTGLAGTPVLLVNPGVAVVTGAVFAGWDGIDRGALPDGDPKAAMMAGRNDLEAPARALQPVIGDVLAALTAQAGTTLVRMSGSGATCFALFSSQAACEAASVALAAAQPVWWVMPTRLV